jgi:hypothetical protein
MACPKTSLKKLTAYARSHGLKLDKTWSGDLPGDGYLDEIAATRPEGFDRNLKKEKYPIDTLADDHKSVASNDNEDAYSVGSATSKVSAKEPKERPSDQD